MNTILFSSNTSSNIQNDSSMHRISSEVRTFDTHGIAQRKRSWSNQRRGKRVRINVAGKRFETYESTLKSKEGSIFKLKNISRYYDHQNMEYFFDNDPKVFEAILVYLQCGILKQPEKVSLKNFVEELQFYGFHKKALRLYKSEGVQSPERYVARPRKEIGIGRYIYDLMEHPDINLLSRTIAITSSLIIFLSIIVFCIGTLPSMKEQEDTIFGLEAFCVVWFTLELVLRFVLAPSKLEFIKTVMNIIDLLSIVPFYLEFLFNENNSNVVAIAMLRVLRITRVFRIFKLSRYSKAIFLLFVTVRASVRELLLLLMFIIIIMILFAASIYQFEVDLKDSENKFKSIPHTFWLVIVTITTVGYGDMVPNTPGIVFE